MTGACRGIADALEIPLVRGNRIAQVSAHAVGYHPTDNAALRRPAGFDVLVAGREWLTVVADVLHELCHVIAGPASIEDEGALMALQWALMLRLPASEYAACRLSWRSYVLEDTAAYTDHAIGPSDDFLETADWADLVNCAIREGLLGVDRAPKVRIHPDW